MVLSEQDQIIAAHMPLVKLVVAQESVRLKANTVLQDELRSYALEGLVIALKKYDKSRGASFRHYAEKQMRWTIYDNLRTTGANSRTAYRRGRFLACATEMMAGEAESGPPKNSTDAVHRFAGSIKGLVTAYIVTASADQVESKTTVPPEAEQNVSKKSARALLLAHITTLTQKEQQVVVGYFFEYRTLTDIAKEMRVTKSWTSKILKKALKKLETILKDNPELLSALKAP